MENKIYKKKGRKPAIPKGDIIDLSIINNKSILDAKKKTNKELKDKRRLREDNDTNNIKHAVNKKIFLEFLK